MNDPRIAKRPRLLDQILGRTETVGSGFTYPNARTLDEILEPDGLVRAVIERTLANARTE